MKLKNNPICYKLAVITCCFIVLEANPGSPFPSMAVPSGGEATSVAWSLVNYESFSDPFAPTKTGPTAIVAPVFPFLYAGIMKIFGYNINTMWGIWLGNTLLLAIALGLLPLISKRIGLGLCPGTIAALMGAVFLHIHMDTAWEVFLATFLCVLVFGQLFQEPTMKRSIVFSLSYGLLALTQPAFIILLVPCSTIWWHGHYRMLSKVVFICGLVAVILTPWIIRDYHEFGHFMFIRDGLGLELRISNNPCAAPTFNGNMSNGCHYLLHPDLNPIVARDLLQSGEYKYFQDQQRLALTWIVANPKQFVILTVQRFILFWFPLPDPSIRNTTYRGYGSWLVTLLSIPGLWLLYLSNKRAAAIIATVLLLYPCIYYLVQFDTRYRYPIYWISLLLAGITIKFVEASCRKKWSFCSYWISSATKLLTTSIIVILVIITYGKRSG